MDYIPRKKILIEKYSETILAEEVLNQLFELCHTYTFVYHKISLDANANTPKYNELTYFIPTLAPDNIFLVFSKDVHNQDENNQYKCGTVYVDRNMLTYLYSNGIDRFSVWYYLTNYFQKKTNLIISTGTSNLVSTFGYRLQKYKNHINKKELPFIYENNDAYKLIFKNNKKTK